MLSPRLCSDSNTDFIRNPNLKHWFYQAEKAPLCVLCVSVVKTF
ncbi:hypothetical protein CKA32_000248 [Geitlerinema sp. FC II]|nr:hypothetical protein CKA32_000248 [Geitlerinema sp. FC II]